MQMVFSSRKQILHPQSQSQACFKGNLNAIMHTQKSLPVLSTHISRAREKPPSSNSFATNRISLFSIMRNTSGGCGCGK